MKGEEKKEKEGKRPYHRHEETIKLEETMNLFIDPKKRLPYREKLLSLDEVESLLGKVLPIEPMKRAYIRRINQSTMSIVKKHFAENHIFFIAPKFNKELKYGFSHDPDIIENSMDRMHARTEAYRLVEKQAKNLSNELRLEASFKKLKDK